MEATSSLDAATPLWPPPRCLSEATSAPGYADAVITTVSQIASAEDSCRATNLLKQASLQLGADVAAFVSFIPDNDDHAAYRFMMACDPTWCFEYLQQSWFANDPWLDYAARHSEPICASHIGARNDAQREVLALACRYGFRSAAIIPAPSNAGLSRVGLLCLGSNTPAYFEADGFVTLRTVARGLAMELNEWWIAKLRDEVFDGAELSARDLQLLNWEREGLNSKAIGRLLDMQPTSVDSRFQRLNMKLGVPNRRAAAKVAAEYGLI